jgi:hypothetical protein
VTTIVGILVLGGLIGFGGAFVVKSYREGRRGLALGVGVVIGAIALFLAWMTMMVGIVGPAMRAM